MKRTTVKRPNHNLSVLTRTDGTIETIIITATNVDFSITDIESDIKFALTLFPFDTVDVVIDTAVCVGYHAGNRFFKITLVKGQQCEPFNEIQPYQCDDLIYDIQNEYFAIPGNTPAIFSADDWLEIVQKSKWNYFARDERPQPGKLLNIEIVIDVGDSCSIGQAMYDSDTEELVFISEQQQTCDLNSNMFFVRWQYA